MRPSTLSSLLAVLLLAAPAAAGEPLKIETPSAAGSGSSVLGVSSETYNAEEAQRMLGRGHGIRDTRKVNLGARDPDMIPDASKPGAPPSPPPPPAGGQMRGAPPKPGEPGYSQFPTGDLNVDTGKAMLGGVPKDLRPDSYKAAAALQNADTQWRLGNFKGVIEETSRALRLEPRNTAALAVQADAYMKLRDYKAAEEAMLKSVEISSADATTWGRLSWARLKQGASQDALDAAIAASNENPGEALAWAMRAYALDQVGRREDALAYLEKAASMDQAFAAKYRRAKAGETVWVQEQDMYGQTPRASKSGGLPPWLPWVAGPALLAIGLILVVARSGGGEASPPQEE